MAPFYGWGSTASRLQRHYEETAYFLPLSFQKFVILIRSTTKDERLRRTVSHPVVFNLCINVVIIKYKLKPQSCYYKVVKNLFPLHIRRPNDYIAET